MNKFSFHFKGTYGWDNFSKYLLIIGLIFLLNSITITAGVFSIGYALFRSNSKNNNKRYQELQAFENILASVRQKFYKLKTKTADFTHYKIFTCPKCSQKLRVPRKKGNLSVVCKKCNTSFKGRS